MSESSNNYGIVNISKKNYIQPDYTKPYRPQEYSLNYFSWANIVLQKETHESPKTHYMLMDFFLGSKEDVQALCHRNFAKSTLVTKNAPLYVASTGGLPSFGLVENAIIFSATYKQAVEMLTSIKSKWENSPQLQKVLKLAKTPTRTSSFANVDVKANQTKNKKNHVKRNCEILLDKDADCSIYIYA